MADTIEQIILDVQSVCPDADPNLARLWVRDAGRRTLEAAPWSFLIKRGQFVLAAPVTDVTSSTTCTVTEESDIVDFSGAVAEAGWVGRQFRVSTTGPIYDIIEFVSTTRVRISPTWGEATASAQSFSVFQSRVILPEDCQEILSVISPSNRWQLHLQVPQEILDGYDPSRSRGPSNPSVMSPLDYFSVYAGGVDGALRVIGSGATPVTGGQYTGQSDAIFTVQVTTGGIGGVAVFKWRKNEEAWVENITSLADTGNDLQEGVTVLFPATSTFVLNDVFTIRAHSSAASGLPRWEIYPHPTSDIVLPYLYISSYPDLTEPGVRIPGLLARRGDVLREKALEFSATWPGTEDRPNPYNQINRRDYHSANWLLLVAELVKQDRALFQRAILPAQRLPFAPWPFDGGGNLQEYDPWWYGPSDVLY